MKPKLLFRSFLFSAALGVVSLPLSAKPGFQSLFNGRNLDGWAGLPGYWSVRDGAITGQTTPEKTIKSNTFLVWQGGQPENFELRLKFRLTAQNDKNQANSGVQYRSRVIDPEKYVVGGYQADIDSTGKYIGMLYEEKGRGILMAPGEKIRVTAKPANADKKQKATIDKLGTPTSAEKIAAAYKLGEWNEMRIVARGNRLRHYVNRVLTADVTDADPALAPKSGVIALQLHVGPPMTIQFKDIELKTLE